MLLTSANDVNANGSINASDVSDRKIELRHGTALVVVAVPTTAASP